MRNAQTKYTRRMMRFVRSLFIFSIELFILFMTFIDSSVYFTLLPLTLKQSFEFTFCSIDFRLYRGDGCALHIGYFLL